MNNTKKNSLVELYRFVAVLIIMAHHVGVTGIGIENPFFDGWIFTEFFMILTGFLTCRHFEKKGEGTPAKNAVLYTISKLKPLVPYYVGVTVLAWTTTNVLVALNGGGIIGFIRGFFGDFIFDILTVSEVYAHPSVAPLWYVAALIIVFPIFALIVQIEDKYLKMIITSVYPLMYYGFAGLYGRRDFPNDYLRLLAGLMLGAFAYIIVREIEVESSHINKTVINVIFAGAMLYPVISCYGNKNQFWLDLLCMFTVVALAFSNNCVATKITFGAFDVLGAVSMPLFMTHWYVGSLIEIAGQFITITVAQKVILYYVLSVAVSAIAMLIVRRIAKRTNKA